MTQHKPAQFHYQTNGNPQNMPVLFLHGFLGNGNDWNDVIRLLIHKFYCITVDLPGHGETAIIKNETYSFEETTNALIEFLKQHNFGKCFLVGYSMGGRVALFMTLRYPQLFSKVILESASPGLHTQQERQQRAILDKKISEELETTDFDSFLKKWYSQPIFEGVAVSEKFDKLLSSRLLNNPKTLSQSLYFLGTGSQSSLWEYLPENKIPILLLVGANDIKFQSIAMEMAKSNGFIQIKTVEECSHNIHLMKPEQFAHYIMEFFAEV